jgi:hypothetical protein
VASIKKMAQKKIKIKNPLALEQTINYYEVDSKFYCLMRK